MKSPNAEGNESTLELIYGPVIGFRVLTRIQSYNDGADEYDRVPIYMSIIYNTCACEMSSYRGDSEPSDMRIEAVTDAAKIQELGYQKDTVGFYHGQSCGSYSIRLEPALAFLAISSRLGSDRWPRGYPYPDTMTLDRTGLDDVGVYQIKMTVY